MILYDNIIKLRAINEEDAIDLMDMINDPEIENSVVGYSFPVSLAQQKNWILNLNNDTTIRYAIDADGKFVGVISISNLDLKNRTGNLNIKLTKDSRGKGYASRAVKLLITFCFEELNLNCLYANVIERNNDSRKLWEKLKFSLDGILRQRVYKNGEYHNIISYSFLKDEYNERNW